MEREIAVVMAELKEIESQLPPGTCRFGQDFDEETGAISSMIFSLGIPNLDVQSNERSADIFYWEYQGQLEIHFWSKGMPEPVICTRSDCDPAQFLQWCKSFMPVVGVLPLPQTEA
jgi:hypothetical protein